MVTKNDTRSLTSLYELWLPVFGYSLSLGMLSLIVIRTSDIQALHEFYKRLGFSFDYHQHGSSPYHYSATVGDTVIELYPLAKGQEKADEHLRLGFKLERFEEVMSALKQAGVPFSAEPAQTDFGFMATVQDPDGRKVELYKKQI